MSMMRAPSNDFHAVKFYKDAASLASIVCPFLAEGFKSGEPGLVIATEAHRREFETRLVARGIDVGAEIARGALTLLDADQMLDAFMRDGIPMPQLFRDTITPVLETIATRFPGANIRAYGEMVDLLWQREQTAAAIRLEMLWNGLARSHRFGLVCGYSMGNFYKGAAAEEICGLHSHVISETGSRVALR